MKKFVKTFRIFSAESIKAIEKKAEEEGRKSNLNVICIPSSFQAKQLIQENNLTLGSLDNYPEVGRALRASLNTYDGVRDCITFLSGRLDYRWRGRDRSRM